MPVEVRTEDAVATVTLAWPERRNALGPAQVAELIAVIEDAGHSADVKVVVLTGQGAFSAGGDLPAIREITRGGKEAVQTMLYATFQQLPRVLLRCPVPTVAAVDGPAIGLGMDLALLCDQRFLGPRGWLRQGWATLGLIPGTGGELLLRRLAPAALWELIAGQPKIDGPAAARLGLGTAAPGSALEEAGAFARRLAALPRETLEAYARLSRRELTVRLEEHLSQCLEEQVNLLVSAEFIARADAALAASGQDR